MGAEPHISLSISSKITHDDSSRRKADLSIRAGSGGSHVKQPSRGLSGGMMAARCKLPCSCGVDQRCRCSALLDRQLGQSWLLILFVFESRDLALHDLADECRSAMKAHQIVNPLCQSFWQADNSRFYPKRRPSHTGVLAEHEAYSTGSYITDICY